jgi:hypothetical protein
MDELTKAYVAQFTDKQRQTHALAQQMLGNAFDLKKTNGFIAFLKARPAESPRTTASE